LRAKWGGRFRPSRRDVMDRFRLAAHAYRTYGVVYWIGGFYLIWHGVGVRGGRIVESGVVWVVLGLVFNRGHPVSPRPAPRVVRAVESFRAAISPRPRRVHGLARLARPEGRDSPGDRDRVRAWGGEITFRAGALVFLVVTVAAFLAIARAAWAKDAA